MSEKRRLEPLRGKVINPENTLMIRSWRRTKVPYQEMVKALNGGHAYFIAGLNRKTAASATTHLKRLGVKVTHCQAKYEGQTGYGFFPVSVENWVERGVKEGWLKDNNKDEG